jgi:hypothetical protein
MYSLTRTKHRKTGIRFRTWKVKSLYTTGPLKTAVRELETYKLVLVGVQQVRCEKCGTERAEDYTFSCGEGSGDNKLGTGFSVYKRKISVDRRQKFINDRISYIILRGRWCNIIFLNVRAPFEGKSDVVETGSMKKKGVFFFSFLSTL